jgi:hypothetical protein
LAIEAAMFWRSTVLPVRGGRHDQAALALSDGRHEVDDPARAVLDGGIGLDLHLEALVGVEGGEVLEGDLVAGALGLLEVDALHGDEGEVALVLVGLLDHALDGVAGAQGVCRIISGET